MFVYVTKSSFSDPMVGCGSCVRYSKFISIILELKETMDVHQLYSVLRNPNQMSDIM